MMIRSFLPIGQGTFYKESFCIHDGKRISVVYDCGSSTDINILIENIKNNFEKGEEIIAVFISHFDDDHINGLPFLLKYCKVQYLFFPLLTRNDSILTQLYEEIMHGTESVSYQFLNNPFQYIRDNFGDGEPPIMFGVRPVESSQDAFRNQNIEEITSGRDVSGIIFGNREKAFFENWKYIPFNFRESERSQYFIDELKKLFPGKTVTEILNLCKSNPAYIYRVKKAFRAVPGSFNTNSMTLFSGTIGKEGNQYLADIYHCERYCDYPYFRGCRKCYPSRNPSGCLYMGDYDAHGSSKWNAIKNAYKGYWDSIGCIQIPHHGSKHNYNLEIGNLSGYHIITAGTHNKYSHPSSLVIHDLLLKGESVYLVTEQRKSQIDIICSCY